MKICIYGLGAIGGAIGARLALAGYAVSAVARGATLQAVRARGLTLESGAADALARNTVTIQASDEPAALGVQDVVVIAVKTTGLADVARRIAPLLGPQTTVLSAMNGVPWWFFHGLPGAPAGMRLESVDAGGAISRAIAPGCVVGSVTHMSAAVREPGVVRLIAGNGIILGEPDGGSSERLQAIARALGEAGFDVTLSDCIQRDIWFKLWGNMTMNPVSAITGATADRILDDVDVRNFMSNAMVEAAAIGARIGLPIDADPEERHAVTRKLGAFRTSMLQDAEAGRALELDALVGSVVEIGRQVQVPTPWINALAGLARLQAQVRGLYPS